ncbi:hypothetical protein KCP71_08820 [Salmonella enterica subsp. enterica]|nr:hypothetical protein KCP71_08820 [Salmonella enterica subsp. enterica]
MLNVNRHLSGRRHVVKVVSRLHKGKPFAPLVEKTANPVVVTAMAVSPLVISVRWSQNGSLSYC